MTDFHPRPGWLAGSRVRHRRTGALGTVVRLHPYGDVVYARPLVRWDHGATMTARADELERSPDDWLSRAVNCPGW